MRTVFRIVDAGGTEVYRGKRTAVIRKLSTLSRRGDITALKVETGRYDPVVEGAPPLWTTVSQAVTFLARES